MIEIKLLIGIITGLVAVSSGIVTFFTMQTRQNMRIKQLEDEVKELKRKLSLNTSNQIKTEKDLISINAKLDHILEAIEDLKKNGHP